jgi:hypothetical protein
MAPVHAAANYHSILMFRQHQSAGQRTCRAGVRGHRKVLPVQLMLTYLPINSAEIAQAGRVRDKMRKFLWCRACNKLHQSIANRGNPFLGNCLGLMNNDAMGLLRQ